MSHGGELRPASESLRSMRRLALLLVFTAGCLGNLSNDDLRFGTVSGQLVGSEAANARVFLLYHPDLATKTDSAGRFSIAKVPEDDHNPYQLIAIGTTTALTASVEVEGGQVAAPSTGALMGASPVSVSISLSGAPLAGVQVSIEQTPIFAATGNDGVAALGVLPAGRFRMSAARDGITQECSVDMVPPMEAHCAIDFGSPVDAGPADAGPPDAGPADAGPPDAGPNCDQGCPSGQTCDPADGRCYLCVHDDDCGGGLVCVGHACGAAANSCQSCTMATDCLGGACIQVFPDQGQGKQCVAACYPDGGCGQGPGAFGFSCDPNLNLCVPNTSQLAACGPGMGIGTPCTGPNDCLEAGLLAGVCVGNGQQGTCSVACSLDSDCPPGWGCQPDGNGGGFCQDH
jgi:hypothetical protein